MSSDFETRYKRARDLSINVRNWKGELKEYLDKQRLGQGTYETEAEGPHHSRLFRSSVIIDSGRFGLGPTRAVGEWRIKQTSAEHSAADKWFQSYKSYFVNDPIDVYKNKTRTMNDHFFGLPKIEDPPKEKPLGLETEKSLEIFDVTYGYAPLEHTTLVESSSRLLAEANQTKADSKSLVDDLALQIDQIQKDTSNLLTERNFLVEKYNSAKALAEQTAKVNQTIKDKIVILEQSHSIMKRHYDFSETPVTWQNTLEVRKSYLKDFLRLWQVIEENKTECALHCFNYLMQKECEQNPEVYQYLQANKAIEIIERKSGDSQITKPL